jgi:hypothetical protein
MSVKTGDNMIDDETKARIREQSKTVANYIASNEKFENWFYEIEGFGFRSERFYSDCEYGNNECLRNWLLTAWQLGYEAGCNRD